MKAVKELKQNSPEWHEWRKEGLGASEANIIMGVSKFCTPLELWEKKVNGERVEDQEKLNFITEKGHRLEAKARPFFEMEMDNEFPDMIAVMEKNKWLRASLDGYCEETGELWECKFVGQDDFDSVQFGKVLDKYYPQLQHQMMVTGSSVNYLYVIADDKEKKEAGSKFPFKTAYLKVPADFDYIENKLYPELLKFWQMVTNKVAPKITEMDTVNLDSNRELAALLQDYETSKALAVDWKRKEDEFKKEIYKICKHSKNTCNGVKITKSKSEDKLTPDYAGYVFNHFTDMDDDKIIKSGFSKVTKGRITKRITFPKES